MEKEKKKIVLTDVDGVILDYDKAFLEFLQKEKKIENLLHFRETYKTRPEIQNVHKEFNDSEAFGNLECFEDARHALELLSKTHDIVAISACGDDAKIKQKRVDNLSNLFDFDFAKVICLPLDACKASILEKYPRSLWVDDQFKNAKAGSLLGHTSFLRRNDYFGVPSESELLQANVTAVDSWFDILSLF